MLWEITLNILMWNMSRWHILKRPVSLTLTLTSKEEYSDFLIFFWHHGDVFCKGMYHTNFNPNLEINCNLDGNFVWLNLIYPKVQHSRGLNLPEIFLFL